MPRPKKPPSERKTKGPSYSGPSGTYANPRRKITATAEQFARYDEAARAAGYAHTSQWIVAVADAAATRMLGRSDA